LKLWTCTSEYLAVLIRNMELSFGIIVLAVSHFRRRRIRDTLSWSSVAKMRDRLGCSDPPTTSFYFAMMVLCPSLDPFCYDWLQPTEFGLYVDKHGDPSRSGNTIEWEGTAERVAFHHPYILLFDARFVEIRHVTTGRLAQIISGTDVRCTWDGRGISSTPRTSANGQNEDVQEAQVHFVMNSTDFVNGPGGMRSKNIVQHVCELIPTVTLFPEATPTSATFFSPQSPGLAPNAPQSSSSNSHQYSNSFSSSLNSYVSTTNLRSQNYPTQPSFAAAPSQPFPNYGVPQP